MRKLSICGLILCIIITASSCDYILEGEKQAESPHVVSQSERPPEELIEVSDYDGLKNAMLGLIMEHETRGMCSINSYPGDFANVTEDVERAKDEIMNNDPFGVFAVAEIDSTVTRIVSFFEVDIEITYKRSKEQVESIVNVSTLRYLRTELQNVMSEYREEAVFLTSLEVTEEDIAEYVRDTYYQNPRSIVMLPVMVAEMFPAGENDSFIELHFIYTDQVRGLQQFGASLAGSVRRNALMAGGENDGEILLSLVENLIGACIYDEGTARAISEHGAQNFAATAYGALVGGRAVGEGFAMAFKALCDELGFDCRVVLGSHNGRVHAWNIVSLYGENYHIDAAMCALNGVETAFLKTDAEFFTDYRWDIVNTVRCTGTLTYEEVAGIEIDPGDEPGEETGEGEENGEDAENGEDEETGEGKVTGEIGETGEGTGTTAGSKTGETGTITGAETGETNGEATGGTTQTESGENSGETGTEPDNEPDGNINNGSSADQDNEIGKEANE